MLHHGYIARQTARITSTASSSNRHCYPRELRCFEKSTPPALRSLSIPNKSSLRNGWRSRVSIKSRAAPCRAARIICRRLAHFRFVILRRTIQTSTATRDPFQGAGLTRTVKFVGVLGTTQAYGAGQPASVSALRQSVAVACETCEGSTAPLRGSA